MQVLLAISHSLPVSKEKDHKNLQVVVSKFLFITPLKVENCAKKLAILCIILYIFLSFNNMNILFIYC